MNKIICLMLVAVVTVTFILNVSVSAAHPLRDRNLQNEAFVDNAK